MHPEDTPATLAPWARTTTFWSGGALFLAGFAMSAWSLTMFMLMLGVPDGAAWTLFLALDAGAIVGVVMWVGGTGAIEAYGRSTARTLFLLSILGNGLERLLAFGTPAGQAPPVSAEATLAQFVALLRRLFNWADPLAAIALWFVLLVSIAVGIVFPTLAYRMGHAIILARQAVEATTRRRAGKVTTALARLLDRAGQSSTPAPTPTAASPAPARAATPPTPGRKATPAADSAATAPRMPYVHDPKDHPVGSPAWEDRYQRLPGDTKSDKLEYWLTREWEYGREPVLAVAERVVNGSRLGSSVKAKLSKRGVFPPSEAPAEAPQELAAVS